MDIGLVVLAAAAVSALTHPSITIKALAAVWPATHRDVVSGSTGASARPTQMLSAKLAPTSPCMPHTRRQGGPRTQAIALGPATRATSGKTVAAM